MTPTDLETWITSSGLKRTEAAGALGISYNRLLRYLRADEDAELPRYIGLACAAISHGIKPL